MRLFLGFVFIALAAVAMFATYSSSSYYQSVITHDKTVIIAPGMGAEGTLRHLHAHGVLPAPWKIALPVLFSKQYRKLKAGEYDLRAGMTPEQILNKIARGEVVTHKLTIPEGLTSAEVAGALMREPLLEGEVPLSMPEGRLYPDTYHFQRGEKRAAVVARMMAAMEEKLHALWQARAADLPLASPQEALVLASIVEKETGIPEERAMVAGVYINRLKKGMKLQADPTVAYGIHPSGELDRPLTFKDLERDTPYNTYTREGLPPGPICNPGLAAIEAVLHPQVTDALYFVADGNGGHKFATTNAEHLKNVAAWRKHSREEAKKQEQTK